MNLDISHEKLTTRVVAGCEQDTAGCVSLPDNMAGSRCTQYAILPNQQLLDTVGCPNFGNQLHDLWIVESSISSNNQEAALDALRDREEDTGDERLAVVGLLEDCDFLSKSRPS